MQESGLKNMPKKKFKGHMLLLIAILAFADAIAAIYTVQSVPNVQLQDARRFVTNPDGIISPEAENTINLGIAEVRDSATAEIAVVLLESIGSEDIDHFATGLFMHWGIGKKNKDNGLLFLLVKDQRQMVFRTGYGLEGVLPDAILSRIIRNDISPRLKEGDFDQGIINGMNKVCNYLKNPEVVKEIYEQEKTLRKQEVMNFLYGYLLIGFLIFLLFVWWIASVLKSGKTNYEKYTSLKGGKIIAIFFTVIFPVFMLFFIIFYVLKRNNLRNKPIKCTECGTRMRKLTRTEEIPYLTNSQNTEETIQSVDYDVWLCDNCNHKVIYPYIKSSQYSTCPACQAAAYYMVGDYIISRATTFSSGRGEYVYACKNCGINKNKQYTIPRIVVPPSSGRGGGGGGFSGGGSWGGGSTGGGGARGGW